MLHKCANPACRHIFRSLNRGKLFLLETSDSLPTASRTAPAIRKERTRHHMERYWLCDDCALLLTLTFERGRGMVTVPLPARNTLSRAMHLTHVQSAAKGCPAELKGAL